MSIPHSFARRLSACVAACSILAAAGTAQAAIIASFDPAFGPSIPNLGFRGSITLDVPNACLALGPGFHNTGGPCQVTALSAQVNFYNANPARDPNLILFTQALNAGFFPTNYVFGIYIDPVSGQLNGFDTNNSLPFTFSVNDPPTTPGTGINYSGTMLLYFQSGMVPIGIGNFSPSITTPGVGGAFLLNCGQSQIGGPNCNSGTSSLPAKLTFTVVPEPESVALALRGLGALAGVRRRTRIAR